MRRLFARKISGSRNLLPEKSMASITDDLKTKRPFLFILGGAEPDEGT